VKPLVTSADQALRLLPHRNFEEAQTLVAAGKKGSGKSWLLQNFIERTEPRVLVFDQKAEYESVRFRFDANVALDELAEGGPVRRRVRPEVATDGREWANKIFRRILDEEIGDFLLVLDELTRWTSNRATELLEQLVTQGRDIGIRTAIGVQQLAMVPGVIQAETTELALFHMSRPRDHETAETWNGSELPGGKEIETVLRNLKVGECILMLDL
jgi:hypothetical protein